MTPWDDDTSPPSYPSSLALPVPPSPSPPRPSMSFYFDVALQLITIVFVGALCVLIAADLSGTKLSSSPTAPGAASHDVFVVFELPSADRGHASGGARGANVDDDDAPGRSTYRSDVGRQLWVAHGSFRMLCALVATLSICVLATNGIAKHIRMLWLEVGKRWAIPATLS